MQILLVEDDELIAKGLTYSFKQNGYNLQILKILATFYKMRKSNL